MKSFRFLHASDIHLDSPLHGLSRYEGLPVDEIRSSLDRVILEVKPLKNDTVRRLCKDMSATFRTIVFCRF